MSRRSWLYAAAAVGLITTIAIVDRAEDVLTHIEYPFDVWRMDLDDILANIGLFLGGLGAFVAMWRKTRQIEVKTDRVADQVNGGMSRIAAEHVAEHLDGAEIEPGLWKRVNALEERERLCQEENQKLRAWVIARLDYSTEGRNTSR